MNSRSFSPPIRAPRSDLPWPEAEWLALWRAFWLDLPLAWADGMARSLRRSLAPAGEGPPTQST